MFNTILCLLNQTLVLVCVAMAARQVPLWCRECRARIQGINLLIPFLSKLLRLLLSHQGQQISK